VDHGVLAPGIGQGFDEAVLEDLHRAFERDFPRWV